ncbi:MAG: enoyl-CoA hydratase-related protein [candidate division KSB1 bacterium]|nr:enoyl-CoA hydratase-related protein [candidate division KSB1 bacterium]
MSAVRYQVNNAIAEIVLDRPERRNALNDEMVEGLLSALHQAQDDASARIVLLRATGETFCAGADLKSGGVQPREGEQPFVTLLRTMWNLPKPIVGCISGSAFGGGLGLIAACDLTVAAAEAQFAFSEVRIGVVPAMISVVVIPKIGIHNAMWLFLTGERFSAEQARQMGLVHRVCPRVELDATVEDVLSQLRLAGPVALQHAKELVRRVPHMNMDDAFRYTSALIAQLFSSAEALEGMQAFAEKRKPSWAL